MESSIRFVLILGNGKFLYYNLPKRKNPLVFLQNSYLYKPKKTLQIPFVLENLDYN